MKKIWSLLIPVLFLHSGCNTKTTGKYDNCFENNGLHKLEYNNPDIMIDLDAGFKAVPLPMDFDGDGDYDLLISESGSYAESGIFYFENISGNMDMPVFRRGMKVSFERRSLGNDWVDFEVSEADGHIHVLTPDQVSERLLIYQDVPQNVFWGENELVLPDGGYDILHNFTNTQWKLADFDGDGIKDLLVSAQSFNPRKYRGRIGKSFQTDDISVPKRDLLAFLKNKGSNESPVFDNPVEILKADGTPLAESLSLEPMFADYDNDGDMDFIGLANVDGNIDVKEHDDDEFVYFENIGNKKEAKYSPGRVLKNRGIPLEMVSQAKIHLTSIDWNKDGLTDMLGGDEDGKISFFKNTGTRSNPKLAAAKPVEVEWNGHPLKPAWVPGTAEGNELLAPWRTSPYIMDFNKDGLNDLVMLDFEGYLSVYIRFKKDGKLMLSPPERLFVFPDGKPILLNQRTGSSSGRLKIDFADWDGDGTEDLIFSSKPAVDWMKGIGMKDGKMVLKYMGRVASRTLMGHTDGPVATDFNKDGIPDLLVGTETGTFYYWQRTSFEVTTTMTTDGKQTPANYSYFKR